jgi:hypothetical protein
VVTGWGAPGQRRHDRRYDRGRASRWLCPAHNSYAKVVDVQQPEAADDCDECAGVQGVSWPRSRCLSDEQATAEIPSRRTMYRKGPPIAALK